MSKIEKIVLGAIVVMVMVCVISTSICILQGLELYYECGGTL